MCKHQTHRALPRLRVCGSCGLEASNANTNTTARCSCWASCDLARGPWKIWTNCSTCQLTCLNQSLVIVVVQVTKTFQGGQVVVEILTSLNISSLRRPNELSEEGNRVLQPVIDVDLDIPTSETCPCLGAKVRTNGKELWPVEVWRQHSAQTSCWDPIFSPGVQNASRRVFAVIRGGRALGVEKFVGRSYRQPWPGSPECSPARDSRPSSHPSHHASQDPDRERHSSQLPMMPSTLADPLQWQRRRFFAWPFPAI